MSVAVDEPEINDTADSTLMQIRVKRHTKLGELIEQRTNGDSETPSMCRRHFIIDDMDRKEDKTFSNKAGKYLSARKIEGIKKMFLFQKNMKYNRLLENGV